MSGLLSPRQTYKPFLYQQAYEYWLQQQQAHWLHLEVSMSGDIQDWKSNLTESERAVVAGILKGFIQTELVVNDYWTRRVGVWFPHPEIGMMASTFGSTECFDDQTELLTNTGWKSVCELSESDVFAQFDLETQKVTFAKPTKIVSYDYVGLMHHYKSATTDICVTPNHDLILVHPTTRRLTKKKSYEGKWGKNHLYPSSGYGCGSDTNLTTLDRLLISIQADGSLKTTSSVQMELTKQRKIDRLIGFLEELNIEYSLRHRPNRKGVIVTFALDTLLSTESIKSFTYVVWENFSATKAKAFLQELLFWDGSGPRHWYNTNVSAVNVVQAIASIAGISTNVGINRTAEQAMTTMLPQGTTPKTTKNCYVVGFIDKPDPYRVYPHRKEVMYEGKVYCVSVPTQNLISRRNWKVAITGNTIHTTAYAYLNDSLGIEDYDSFLNEPTAKAKLDRIHSIFDENKRSKHDIALSLAAFSAFTEGVSIFSAFAVLLNFSRFNRLKGVGQIISWSIRDESLHSRAGTWLFREFIKENHKIWTDELKKEIYDAARLTVSLEDAFIDQVFSLGEIEGISAHDVKAFIRHRANVKLQELGLKTNWKHMDKEAIKRMEWFDFLSAGVEHQDFFAQRPVDYSKGSLDWSDAALWGTR